MVRGGAPDNFRGVASGCAIFRGKNVRESGVGTPKDERLNTAALNFDLYTSYSVLCWYECTYLYRECAGITSLPQGDWYCGGCSPPQKKTVNFKSVVHCVHLSYEHNSPFIMSTARLSNVIVTDLKFTDLFLLSSGEESSPYTTGPLGTERLYTYAFPVHSYYYTDTELSKLRLSMHNVHEVKVQRWTHSCI